MEDRDDKTGLMPVGFSSFLNSFPRTLKSSIRGCQGLQGGSTECWSDISIKCIHVFHDPICRRDLSFCFLFVEDFWIFSDSASRCLPLLNPLLLRSWMRLRRSVYPHLSLPSSSTDNTRPASGLSPSLAAALWEWRSSSGVLGVMLWRSNLGRRNTIFSGWTMVSSCNSTISYKQYWYRSV